MTKINGILRANNSMWHLHEMYFDTTKTTIMITVSFHTVDALWTSLFYYIDYGGALLETHEVSLAEGRSHPFKEDFFVNFDLDPYFHKFLEAVVIETQKKRTACMVSKRIREELVERVKSSA